MNQQDIDRFWRKVEVRSENECWYWLAGKSPKGYGSFWLNGKDIRAHRIAYELHNGCICDNLLVCHSCDNPSCVNPSHLWQGTSQDNAIDKVNKGRHVNNRGENCGTHKLTYDQVNAIRSLYKSKKYNQYELAYKFNVNQSQISRIVNRKRWEITIERID